MLIMKRKVDQRILIGENIWVTVCEVCGKNEVRLGVDAPPTIPVLREELIDERVPQRDGLASDAGR
jgi:carbon storage regulator